MQQLLVNVTDRIPEEDAARVIWEKAFRGLLVGLNACPPGTQGDDNLVVD